MARPLRIEYPGALYHVTSRGNARNKIFKNNNDKEYFLSLLGFVVKRFHWLCHAYCLMDNHYHLVIETPEGNLSRGMRQVNGIYTQRYNRQHKKTGHVFQGRYKAILIDKDSYLLELCRYVALNPVRAKIVDQLQGWKWSSYLPTAGITEPTECLTTDWILGQFSKNKKRAQKLYNQFVLEGITKETPWKNINGQIFLGDKRFVEKCKDMLNAPDDLKEIPRTQRFAGRPPLAELFHDKTRQNKVLRNEAIHKAHTTWGYTLSAIAEHLHIHYTTISKIVKGHGEI